MGAGETEMPISGHNRRGLNYIGRLMFQREKLIRIGVVISQLLESSSREHNSRIKLAKKAINILNDFIEFEVHAANNLPKEDPAHMSWEKIGNAVGLSRSAAYTRYGAKGDKTTEKAHNS